MDPPRAARTSRADASCCRAGSRLTPQALGLAASVGAATLQVARRPRVALFSTGDELAMPGETLKPGAIYNSNRYTLRALVEALGCPCEDLGIVPDTLEATREALRRAARANDLIVTSGGVSVGEEDHLRPAVRAEGALDLWQVAIKPGKPLAFGEVRREAGGAAWFIGLPGNPVSSFVTFLLAVRPFLLRLQGRGRCRLHRPAAARRLRLAASRPPPRVPARSAQRRRRARLCSPTRARVCSPRRSGATASSTTRPGKAIRAATASTTCRSRVVGMKVSVRYFASMREASAPGETIEVEPGVETSARCATP